VSRLVAGVVIVAAVAACGSDDASLDTDRAATTTAPERSPTTSLADAPPPARVGEALDAQLLGEDRVPAGPHTWMIELTNTSDQDVVVTFPTSQRGDVVIEREGEVVHRWSSDRFFTQEVTEVPLAAGASEVLTLEDDLSAVEPGFYDAIVTVSVVGPPEPLTRSIRVVSPGG
jgi:hypothetical protein